MSKIEHEHYSLDVNTEKNRVYFKLIGNIPSVDAIPDFESDWMKVLDEMGLQKGFTILGDLRKVEPLPQDVQDLQTKVQTTIMQKGCSKVAQIAPIAVVVEVNKFSEGSGLKEILRGFSLVSSGERWLDR
ncbi:MAG: hypothetical protein ACW964_09650 [Candidatus Hodarchaeales archaeon]|jgi:hypothetical protein